MTDSVQSHPLLLSTNESSPTSNSKHHYHHILSTSPINQPQQSSASSLQSLLPSSSSSISSSSCSSNLKASTSTSVLTTDTTTLSTIKNNDPLTNSNQTSSSNQYFTTYPTRRNHTISTPSRNRNLTPSNYSTFSHSSLDQNSQSSTPLATDALLFQSLRAEAQSLGLEPDSLGWAILRYLSSSSSRPIRSLLRQLSSFNLLLILPRAINHHSDTQANLDQETIYDHLILLSSLDQLGSACCFSSLTGWKGLLEGDRLLVSTPGKSLSTLQNQFHLDPSSLIPTIKPSTSLSSELTAPSRLRLPLYSLSSSSSHTLTLPGLPSTRPHSINTNTTTQRLASLFGPRPTPSPSSLPESSSSEVEPADEPIQLKVRILTCSTLTSELLDQAVSDAVRNRIRDGLGSLEESVLDSIDQFVERFAVHNQRSSLFLAPKNVVGDCLQTLYHTIQSELEEEYGHDEGNVIVDHTLELVEETICVELYERLFEDDHDDEGLSEKIAGLNLLDVTLERERENN
ncbi:uncharacterized protein MELLADRAFT_87358 [Melampsora larici-populina 98AG31]|uniref:Uncharacterized protein n=1 Tax=Melampsora larici-populina (strain 98AG31 / pathotype 3-4-7) TaxID=747676 RepID=F4RN03_MELLP|nr:uncharacterized protein MELLADRAFT_87358 [Melampsora larici-populina 98AG31]EGG06213.1 hypothetical protein MELLADRAFT_87358 [Melampsora larici-populina 98AG31]